MKILALISVYLPGFKSGGPVRTIASTVDQLGDSFEFWILTGDRDFKDTEPFADVPLDKWIPVGKAQVYYANLNSLSFGKLKNLISDLEPDIVYLNSFFSSLNRKYLMARRLGIIPQIPTIVAPRGSFSPGALRLKQTKKWLYLQAAHLSGLFDGLSWHAATEIEKRHILASLPYVKDTSIFTAPDLANSVNCDIESIERLNLKKEPDNVRFIYLSRVSHSKNLIFALTILQEVSGHIDFDIYGPIEDPIYWENCQQIITNLPKNISIHVHGAVPHVEVEKVLSNAHFLLLPTMGESFGHVIFEALQVGLPIIISDRTPWQGIPESAAGWIIPLEERVGWIEILQHCTDMGPDEFVNHSKNARDYAVQRLSSSDGLDANRNMFLYMC